MKTTQEKIEQVKEKIETNEREIDRLFDQLNQEVDENGVGSLSTTMQLEILQDISDKLSLQMAELIAQGAKEVKQALDNKRNRGV